MSGAVFVFPNTAPALYFTEYSLLYWMEHLKILQSHKKGVSKLRTNMCHIQPNLKRGYRKVHIIIWDIFLLGTLAAVIETAFLQSWPHKNFHMLTMYLTLTQT